MEKEGPIKQQLLIAFLDLLSFEKKVNNWSEEKFSENPPRLHRLKIINALMKALQIKCSYADFLNGEFITEDNLPDKAEVLNQTALIHIGDLRIKSNSTWSVSKAKFVFKNLMNYRLRLLDLSNFGNGVMAVSGCFRIPFLVSSTFNDKLSEPIANLDNLLLLFLNPSAINYSRAVLIADYGYPDIDLTEVDIDWL